MIIEKIITHSPDETEKSGAMLAKKLNKNDFVALYGDLGAGKTAFVRGMAGVLVPNAFVSSPTYTLVNEYSEEGTTFCHFDMYRIDSEDDLYSIGFYDYDNCIIAAEWCEKIPFALPDRYYKVTIEKTQDDNERLITIEVIE